MEVLVDVYHLNTSVLHANGKAAPFSCLSDSNQQSLVMRDAQETGKIVSSILGLFA